MRNHQSAESSTVEPVLVFSLAVNALRENKHRHKALSVSCVCLDLTLVCVCVCVPVHICVANHIKEWESSSVVKTPDPGVLQNTGRVVEKQIKIQFNLSANAWACAQWMMSYSASNCLLNFYTDLWQTHKWSHTVHALKLQWDSFHPIKPTYVFSQSTI